MFIRMCDAGHTTIGASNMAKTLAAATISALAVTLAVATPVQAQENGRYRLETSENGYVRLDTQTGAISLCDERSGQLVCKMAADDVRAYEDDLGALQKRVKALEDKVATLERPASGAPSASGLPSETEFEQTLSYMERFMRRFMSIAKSFDETTPKEAPTPTPGRT